MVLEELKLITEYIKKCIYMTFDKAIITLFMLIFGELVNILIILAIFIILDLLSGVVCSIKNKTFRSRGFSKTAYKTFAYISAIAVVRLFELELLSDTHLFSSIVISTLISTEGISILENCNCLGMPIRINLKNIKDYFFYIEGDKNEKNNKK